MGSFNTIGCGDEWNSYVDDDLLILEKILEKGIRVVDFELFLKGTTINDKVYVAIGIPDEKKKYQFKGSYNDVEFSNVLDKLNNYVGDKDTYKNNPLFVNLRIKTTEIEIFKKIGNDISGASLQTPDEKFSLKRFLLDIEKEQNDYKNIINSSSVDDTNGKILFILNENPLNPLGSYIKSLKNDFDDPLLKKICITDSNYDEMSNAIVMKTNSIINGHNKEMIIDDFKKYLGIALPDWSTIKKNPDYTKIRNMGCQIALMKFSYNDDNLKEYIKFWEKENNTIIKKKLKNDEDIEMVELELEQKMDEEQKINTSNTVKQNEGRQRSGGAARAGRDAYEGGD